MNTQDKYEVQPGSKVLYDAKYYDPNKPDFPLPPATERISEMISTRDVQGLVELAERELSRVFPSIHHRLEALLENNLLNDREFEQIMTQKDPKMFEQMLTRVENQEFIQLKEQRKEELSFEELEEKFPVHLQKNPGYRLQLQNLMENKQITPEELEVVQTLLENGDINELGDELTKIEKNVQLTKNKENGGGRQMVNK